MSLRGICKSHSTQNNYCQDELKSILELSLKQAAKKPKQLLVIIPTEITRFSDSVSGLLASEGRSQSTPSISRAAGLMLDMEFTFGIAHSSFIPADGITLNIYLSLTFLSSAWCSLYEYSGRDAEETPREMKIIYCLLLRILFHVNIT